MLRLRHWLRLRLLAFATDYTPPVEWTKADSERLRAFMKGETGLKLAAQLRGLTFRGTLGAVHSVPEKLPWQCGHAAGMQNAVQILDQLANWNAEPDQQAAAGTPTDDLTWLHGRDATNGR